MGNVTETNTLYLLRHAKSSWGDPALADRERPLAPRGLRDAAALAKHLDRERISPELLLCSSARRARETLAGILPGLADEAVIRIEDLLYAASAAELLARARAVPAGVRSAMIIGHNPGLEELASQLGAEGRLPTGALVTFELPGAWSTLGDARCRLVARRLPRDPGSGG